MINDKFCMMITEILSSESYDFSAVREILVQYKEAGMKQGDMEQNLLELRSASSDNEIFEDRLLELLDCVVGWCYPTNKVY